MRTMVDVRQICSDEGLYFNVIEAHRQIGVWTNYYCSPFALFVDKEHHAVFCRIFKDTQSLDDYIETIHNAKTGDLVWRSDKGADHAEN